LSATHKLQPFVGEFNRAAIGGPGAIGNLPGSGIGGIVDKGPLPGFEQGRGRGAKIAVHKHRRSSDVQLSTRHSQITVDQEGVQRNGGIGGLGYQLASVDQQVAVDMRVSGIHRAVEIQIEPAVRPADAHVAKHVEVTAVEYPELAGTYLQISIYAQSHVRGQNQPGRGAAVNPEVVKGLRGADGRG